MGESTTSRGLESKVASPSRDVSALVRIKNYWALAIGYSVLLGGLYLHGYWIEFGIRPLEYIGASDIIKVAAYPLSIVLVLYLGSFALGGVLGVAGGLAERSLWGMLRLLALRAARRHRMRKVHLSLRRLLFDARKAMVRWGWVLIVGTPLTLLFFTDEHRVLLVGLCVATIVASLAIYAANRPSPSAPRTSALLFGIALALFFPFAALDGGITAAQKAARADLRTVRVDTQSSHLPVSSTKAFPVVHLGLLGNTHFMFESATRRTVAVAGPLKEALYLLPPGVEPRSSQQSASGNRVRGVNGPRQ